MLAPVFVILMSSTHQTQTLQQAGLQWIPGGHGFDNYSRIMSFEAGYFDQVTPLLMLFNSLVVAMGVATLTTLLSFLAAYALVFFNIKIRNTLFWLILTTLLFPLESRFITTFQVTADLGLINSHLGIILPVLAAALGTFFFASIS